MQTNLVHHRHGSNLYKRCKSINASRKIIRQNAIRAFHSNQFSIDFPISRAQFYCELFHGTKLGLLLNKSGPGDGKPQPKGQLSPGEILSGENRGGKSFPRLFSRLKLRKATDFFETRRKFFSSVGGSLWSRFVSAIRKPQEKIEFQSLLDFRWTAKAFNL